MDWLTKIFAEQSVSGLLFSTVVALASGFLSSWLTYRFVKQLENPVELDLPLVARMFYMRN